MTQRALLAWLRFPGPVEAVTGDGVGPPPPEQHVQQKPGEHDRGEPDTQHGLRRVGFDRAASHLVSDAPLGSSQERHDDERDGGDSDPDGADTGMVPADEFAEGLERDPYREQQEGCCDELDGAPFGGFGDVETVPLLGKAPQDDRAGEDLNERVDAEAEESDGSGHRTRRDRDHALDGVPSDRGPGQPSSATDECVARCRHGRFRCRPLQVSQCAVSASETRDGKRSAKRESASS